VLVPRELQEFKVIGVPKVLVFRVVVVVVLEALVEVRVVFRVVVMVPEALEEVLVVVRKVLLVPEVMLEVQVHVVPLAVVEVQVLKDVQVLLVVEALEFWLVQQLEAGEFQVLQKHPVVQVTLVLKVLPQIYMLVYLLTIALLQTKDVDTLLPHLQAMDVAGRTLLQASLAARRKISLQPDPQKKPKQTLSHHKHLNKVQQKTKYKNGIQYIHYETFKLLVLLFFTGFSPFFPVLLLSCFLSC